jgi:hypothetical protein
MITVGLIKELYFIAAMLKRDFYFELTPAEDWKKDVHVPLTLRLTPKGVLDVWYRNVHIWNETVEGDNSFFGVESCDNISRIVSCIDNKDFSWKDKYYFSEGDEKRVDVVSNFN